MSTSKEDALLQEGKSSSLSLASITDGFATEHDGVAGAVPKARFIEDIDAFSTSFDPPASAELMIGAYSDLFGKLKTLEESLAQRALLIQSKIPEIEKSLKLVTFLKNKEDSGSGDGDSTKITTRYNLADMLHAKAEIDTASGIVNLWLGANVMLEYTYQEAVDLLQTKDTKAKKDLTHTKEDLAAVRNQVITSEVNISRIYNWDVRQKRKERMADAEAKATSS
uniref:Prefoldin subunit 3 n=1 Tax=Chaetoceros debilis TaxID=122233 RepID=A0A7S3Q0Q6_9STRA|mmetsp:Transcript_11163/g.16942  ORF Transcript_11163/g.16942 Transcript_11163/m.16942 type:complete len:224 (+) Transcript_11163:189-860(+)